MPVNGCGYSFFQPSIMGPAKESRVAASAYSRAFRPRISATRGWSGAKRKSRKDDADTGYSCSMSLVVLFGSCGVRRRSSRPPRPGRRRRLCGTPPPGHVLVGADQHGVGAPEFGHGGPVVGRSDGGNRSPGCPAGPRSAATGAKTSVSGTPAKRAGVGQQGEAGAQSCCTRRWFRPARRAEAGRPGLADGTYAMGSSAGTGNPSGTTTGESPYE